MLCGRVEKKLLDTKLVHSGQPQVSTTNSKRPWSSPCCSSTPQPVSSMSVEAELVRTQTVSTMPSQQCRSRGCCGPDFVHYATSFIKRGGTVAKLRHICPPLEANKGRLQAGARVKGLSGAASNDTTSQHGRFNLGIFLSSVNTAGLCKIQSHRRSSPRWGNGRSRAQRFSPRWCNGRSRA